MTAREAAAFLRISLYTLRGWTSRGIFAVVKVGRRALYRVADVELVAKAGLEALKTRSADAPKGMENHEP